jgi:putative transposase
MVRYRRNFLPGGTFFITAALLARRARALVDHIWALRTAIRLTRRRYPFGIDAIVVLPDHLHMLMTLPDGDANFSMRWSLIKRRFTDAVVSAGTPLPRHRNGEAALWQRRFWEHTIRDDGDFERHVNYIHYNPVKHGLVKRVCDWPYSSFHRYVRLGALPRDWGGDAAARLEISANAAAEPGFRSAQSGLRLLKK